MTRSDDTPLGFIGRLLRAEYEDTHGQPLPQRWIDLIHHLNDQERQRSNLSPPQSSDKSARTGITGGAARTGTGEEVIPVDERPVDLGRR